MSLESDSKRTFAKVQRTPDGRLFGAAIFLDAEVIERFVDDGAEEIEYKLKAVPDGIMFEMGGGRDVRVTQPLARLYGMTRAVLLWVIRELLLDLIIDEIK